MPSHANIKKAAPRIIKCSRMRNAIATRTQIYLYIYIYDRCYSESILFYKQMCRCPHTLLALIGRRKKTPMHREDLGCATCAWSALGAFARKLTKKILKKRLRRDLSVESKVLPPLKQVKASSWSLAEKFTCVGFRPVRVQVRRSERDHFEMSMRCCNLPSICFI